MRHWFIGVAILLLAVVAIGCSSDSDEAEPTVEGNNNNVAVSETTDESSDSSVVPAAGPNEFRSDPVARVASSGRPQLVEVFAFW